MKANAPLLIVSLVANVALGAWLMHSTAATTATDRRVASESRPITPGSSNRVAPASATMSESGNEREDPVALRDRLRALGFPEGMVRAAVRAIIEAPRLARERALRGQTAGQPWWRPDLATAGFSATEMSELRGLRRVEREEIMHVLGPVGSVTPAEIEPYAFLPEEKAARLALLQRDYFEARREPPTGSGAPLTRAETLERETLLKSEHDRALAALLTPEEREQVEMRTSTAAFIIGLKAPYFSGTEDEYRKIFDLERAASEARNALDSTPLESRGRAGIDASQNFQSVLLGALSADRYAQWQRAQQADYTALVELQRRFGVPQATLDAVAAVPRQISIEGLAIADDQGRTEEQKLAALRDLADNARGRVRAILGDDLGDAYNVASARGWLDDLERGFVPYDMPNGQRAVRMVDHQMGRMRTPAPRGSATPPVSAPNR